MAYCRSWDNLCLCFHQPLQDLELGKFGVLSNGDKPAHSAGNGSLAAVNGKDVAAYAGTGIRGYTTALPFEPLVFTFKDVSYSVPMPEVSGFLGE